MIRIVNSPRVFWAKVCGLNKNGVEPSPSHRKNYRKTESMPYDYSQATIPVYPGINDLVIPPNNTKGGNGGHLVQQINRIAENLNNDLAQIENQVTSVEQNQQQLNSQVTTQFSTVNSGLETLDAKTQQLETDLNTLLARFDPETSSINVQGLAYLTSQKNIHVAVAGDDVSGDGSFANPYATPRRALQDVANQTLGQEGSIHIKIAPGYYSDGDKSWLPNFIDSGQYYTRANAGNQGYEIPTTGMLVIEGTGTDIDGNPDPAQTRINCQFNGQHTNGRILFQNLTFGRDPNETDNVSWRWGIYLEQHTGWIYLRNLRVLNIRSEFIYAGNAQILAEGDINIVGSCPGVFYLNDSKFVNRALTIRLEASAACRYYWNTYASTIECWFYGDIDYKNNTGSPITGNYFALNSQYNCYADLPGFAYSGDEFTTDGCPFFGYYQNYWAMWEGDMAVMYRQGDLPPGQTEYDEQEFQIDCAFDGTFRTNGNLAFFSNDKAKAVGQQTVENSAVFANANGSDVAGGADSVDLADLNAKLNSLESKVNQIINALQMYGLFGGA